ncbi:hypothetical protein K505DRAFT_157490 [Melanomma pulvis-pyrius CBS 109.77]|uniref:Uncharacterized protein n=1 Tax=Melanomma pulvis-pyrius CBS 109.77 TaxID=1314802 RepID=A0A6A6XJK8_9PLEO|nr:hypothetical protein K505DRAFT_157490 [Melanomma pulvis-pyrius CBS 109.77]
MTHSEHLRYMALNLALYSSLQPAAPGAVRSASFDQRGRSRKLTQHSDSDNPQISIGRPRANCCLGRPPPRGWHSAQRHTKTVNGSGVSTSSAQPLESPRCANDLPIWSPTTPAQAPPRCPRVAPLHVMIHQATSFARKDIPPSPVRANETPNKTRATGLYCVSQSTTRGFAPSLHFVLPGFCLL